MKKKRRARAKRWKAGDVFFYYSRACSSSQRPKSLCWGVVVGDGRAVCFPPYANPHLGRIPANAGPEEYSIFEDPQKNIVRGVRATIRHFQRRAA